jgi:hypothetical protein
MSTTAAKPGMAPAYCDSGREMMRSPDRGRRKAVRHTRLKLALDRSLLIQSTRVLDDRIGRPEAGVAGMDAR